jgi:hypothetical protein
VDDRARAPQIASWNILGTGDLNGALREIFFGATAMAT